MAPTDHTDEFAWDGDDQDPWDDDDPLAPVAELLGEPERGSIDGQSSVPTPTAIEPDPVRQGRRQAEVAELGTSTDKSLSTGFLEVEMLREQAGAVDWEDADSTSESISGDQLTPEQWSLIGALEQLSNVVDDAT